MFMSMLGSNKYHVCLYFGIFFQKTYLPFNTQNNFSLFVQLAEHTKETHELILRTDIIDICAELHE